MIWSGRTTAQGLGEESTAGADRNPRPTPLGQPGVKNPLSGSLPRPGVLHLDTNAIKNTVISEPG